MKKKIAFFANGWSGDNIEKLINGMQKILPKNSYDIFMFLGHATYSYDENQKRCESVIYDLPDLQDFEAVVVFGISLNCSDIQEHVYDICLKSGIPVISIGIKKEGCYNITVENYSGMEQLCEHLITEHNVKDIFYVAGSKEHPDSARRQKAIEETLSKHGLPFGEENVFYSDWEVRATTIFFENKIQSKDDLPDAIVCPNDILAEMVINTLFRKGFEVPKDVIVTGFDRDIEGQIFFPSLASVSQNMDKLGEKAAEVIVGVERGDFHEEDYVISCSFFAGDSCGCEVKHDTNSPRLKYLLELPMQREYLHQREIRLHQIEIAISSAERYEKLSNALQDLFYERNGYEGDSFHVLINPEFDDTDSDKGDENGVIFPSVMDVIASKESGKPFSDKRFEIHKLVPGYKHTGANHVYTFVTIYINNCVYGYMVMRDNIHFLQEMVFLKFAETIASSLEFCKKNIQLNNLNDKLSELMNRDALTSVRNRTAYETFISKLLSSYERGNCNDFAVVMFDVNGLKVVNDMYGHEKGDVYLKNCCKMICDYYKHSPIFRIGGDEFVTVLTGEDYKHRDKILSSMRKTMKSMELCFLPAEEKISIASGMAEFVKDSGIDIRDVFKNADNAMYENKREMKS